MRSPHIIGGDAPNRDPKRPSDGLTWLVDPTTREPLPAFVAFEPKVRWLGGHLEWLGAHSENFPGWEESTVDDMGVQYIRKCQRDCCAKEVSA